MRAYELIQDFASKGQDDSNEYVPDVVSVTAEWVVAIVRLKYPMTYRRKDRASFSTFFPDAVTTRGKTLIITSDVLQMQVTNTKSNHITTASTTLASGEVNYLSEILPGDYMAVWMLQEKERADDLIQRIRDGKPCNKFMDGLKFFGKVQTIQKNLSITGDGTRSVRYSLAGSGFAEFDATFYYNPHLAEAISGIGRWMGRITQSFNQLIRGKQIDVNEAIPFFVDLLLGRGIPANLGRGNSSKALKSTAGLEGDYSYILPREFGALIGKTATSKGGGALAYADLIELQTGVQAYQRDRTISDYERGLFEESNPDNYSNDKDKAVIFTPDGPASGSRRDTGTAMMGKFLITRPQLENSSVWSILNHYLNPACNEIYTCLRTNGDGKVVPTLVVRQLPFSSTLVNVPFPVTKFLDLPRWKVHSAIVRGASIGRSDSLRFNFVHILGIMPGVAGGKSDLSGATVRNPPFRDDLDIARNGLRNYSATIPCSFEDIKVQTGPNGSTAASNWMDLMADILMGQHLTLTGTLQLVGIQAPICVGDNLEWDGVIFHIESISHNCSITGDGKKTFSTSLSLSHGVRSNPGQDDITVYAGIKADDQTSFDPASTDEAQHNGNTYGDEPANVENVIVARREASDAKTAETNGPIAPKDAQDILNNIR